jgi:hypothetical protein
VKNKVHRIAERLSSCISQWDGVEAVLLGEAADIEIYDPYFTIDLDVYMQGPIPQTAERKERFADVDGFESSPVAAADQFLMEKLPVSVHFMETSTIEALVHRIINSSWVFHETGTNMFYRIEKGEVLYSRGGWLAAVRASRAEIPGEFWAHVCLRSHSMAERALADLGAAAFRSDDLFFQISAARLLRGVASFLFALNKQFEPSGRMLSERIKALPVVPDGFIGRLDNFLRPEDGLSQDARREIAGHMVRGLVLLGREAFGRERFGREGNGR